MAWIDEEAAIYCLCQLGGKARLVTKYMSEINFISSARSGEVIEIGIDLVSFGRTSITVKSHVRNKFTQETIVTIDTIVMVCVDPSGRPVPHGVTEKVSSL